MSALLNIANLSVCFPLAFGLMDIFSPRRERHLRVLEDVSLDLGQGETLGLVGESGSGKTTLARAVLGLVPRSAGDIAFDGEMIVGRSEGAFRTMRRKAAMMFQDPVASLSPRLKVGTLLVEPFIIHGEPVASRRETAERLLALVGLPAAFAERYPHELSGGQARRVGVARALALNPRMVLADEPTAGLDVSVQGDILNLMTRLKGEFGLSYIVVTHDLALVRHVSDRLAIMYLGRLVELGPTADVFRAPRHPYTRALLDAEPIPDPRRRREDLAIEGEIPSILNRPSGCEFHTRCRFARESCRNEAPDFTQDASGSAVRCHYPLE